MKKPEIGQFIKESELNGLRDAFHVPAILAKMAKVEYELPYYEDDEDTEERNDSFSSEKNYVYLSPGDSVRFNKSGEVVFSSFEQRHGIVDPFLTSVPKDGYFWVLLKPGTVTQLIHHFEVSFPDFPTEALENENYSIKRHLDVEAASECAGCY